MAATATAKREMVEDLIDARMMCSFVERLGGISLACRRSLTNFCSNATNCIG
jgi:hypothetical protein